MVALSSCDHNFRMKPYSEVSEVDENQVTPPKMRFDSQKILLLVPPHFFLNNQTQHQQHRTENSQPMDTFPKMFTEITPFKVVLEDAFSTEVRLNELLHASVQRMDLEAAKHAIIMGADVKLQRQKIMERSKAGFMKWMLMMLMFLV